MINVLVMTPSLDRSSGVARFTYNLISNVDRSIVNIDVISGKSNISDNTFNDSILSKRSRIFEVEDPGTNVVQFLKDVHNIMNAFGQHYDIVHCNVPNAAWCYLREAKRVGINHRILHSHGTKSSDIFLHQIRNAPLIPLGKRYCTDRFACSEAAGEYLFKGQDFHVIKNGIQLEDYSFDAQLRNRHRNMENLPFDSLVIGCVGRMVPAKNLPFAIDIFKDLLKTVGNAFLILVGDGPERLHLIDRVKYHGIEDRVKFLGAREDVNELYSMFDVLFMPSLTEGLPFAAVEAQASGLRCVFSDEVPKDVNLTNENVFVSLNANREEWVNHLIEEANKKRNREFQKIIADKGYSANRNAAVIVKLYEEIAGS